MQSVSTSTHSAAGRVVVVYGAGMAAASTQRTSVLGIVGALVIGVAVAAAGSQGSTQVGPISVFALAGLIAYAINIIAFVPAMMQQTERFFDATGSVTYLTVTIVALLLSDDVDARAYYERADVFLLPAHASEGFPQVLIEAFADQL